LANHFGRRNDHAGFEQTLPEIRIERGRRRLSSTQPVDHPGDACRIRVHTRRTHVAAVDPQPPTIRMESVGEALPSAHRRRESFASKMAERWMDDQVVERSRAYRSAGHRT